MGLDGTQRVKFLTEKDSDNDLPKKVKMKFFYQNELN